MTDIIHRILTGNTLTPRQLIMAGLFVAIWFLMDLVQFIAWIWEKLS